ncbi:hypothetical protein ABIA31_008730 [Catenulispora sp. MAP5-51]
MHPGVRQAGLRLDAGRADDHVALGRGEAGGEVQQRALADAGLAAQDECLAGVGADEGGEVVLFAGAADDLHVRASG